MYEYLRRIWLGDRRDVRLVSYQRDLGVWIFPGVRRVWFLLAIALKLNAVFVPFFFFFLNHMIIVLGYKILHTPYAMAYKYCQLPLGKSQPPKSHWCGTKRTSRPQQETLD